MHLKKNIYISRFNECIKLNPKNKLAWNEKRSTLLYLGRNIEALYLFIFIYY